MKEIVNKFKIEKELVSISEVKNGLVNKSYLVKTNDNKYLLQKINHFVFKNPDELMHNIEVVTKHLINKKSRTLEIVNTIDNLSYYFDGKNFYRMYKYMSDLSNVFQEDSKICLEVGKAIGKFQLDLLYLVY